MLNPDELILFRALNNFWQILNAENPYISNDGMKLVSRKGKGLPFSYVSQGVKYFRLEQIASSAKEAKRALNSAASDRDKLNVLMKFFSDVCRSAVSQNYMQVPVVWLKDGLSSQMLDIHELYKFMASNNKAFSDIQHYIITLDYFHNIMKVFYREIKNIDIASLNEETQKEIQQFLQLFDDKSLRLKLCIMFLYDLMCAASSVAVACSKFLFWLLVITLPIWIIFAARSFQDKFLFTENSSSSFSGNFETMLFAVFLSICLVEIMRIPEKFKIYLLVMIIGLIYPREESQASSLAWYIFFISYLISIMIALHGHRIQGRSNFVINNPNTGAEQHLTVIYSLQDHIEIIVEDENRLENIRVDLPIGEYLSPDDVHRLAVDAVLRFSRPNIEQARNEPVGPHHAPPF